MAAQIISQAVRIMRVRGCIGPCICASEWGRTDGAAVRLNVLPVAKARVGKDAALDGTLTVTNSQVAALR